MARKPGFWVTTEESIRESRDYFSKKRPCIWISADTYRLLKKKLSEYLELSVDKEITIYRERRGEWGEWFETWQLVGGKPKIIKQGWM